MTTYKEVFQLAQEKGYNPLWHFQSTDLPIGGIMAELELTLIQKWLRDEYKKLVFVDRTLVCDFSEPIEYRYWIEHTGRTIEGWEYPAYETALLQGIAEALKLI